MSLAYLNFIFLSELFLRQMRQVKTTCLPLFVGETFKIFFWSLSGKLYENNKYIHIYIYISSSILNTGLIVTSVPIQYIEKKNPSLFSPDLTYILKLLLQNRAGLFSFRVVSLKLAGDEFKMDNLAH